MAALDAMLLLQRANGPQGLQHIARERGDVSAPQLGKRGGVSMRVLTDLELGQREAEGLHLPDQMLQPAVGEARRTAIAGRSLQRAQLRKELGRIRVGARAGNAGRAQPCADRRQPLAERLVHSFACHRCEQRRGSAL